MSVLKNGSRFCYDMIEDLTEYVDYSTSKDIIHELQQMEFDKILNFKQSLEHILNVIGSQTIVH